MLPSAFWLLALILFSVIEGVTVGLTSIWFAAGALGALIAAMLGAHIFLQILIFLVLSALALALVRPIAVRLLKPRHDPTNADRGHRQCGGKGPCGHLRPSLVGPQRARRGHPRRHPGARAAHRGRQGVCRGPVTVQI